jgi:hypothetical protein
VEEAAFFQGEDLMHEVVPGGQTYVISSPL